MAATDRRRWERCTHFRRLRTHTRLPAFLERRVLCVIFISSSDFTEVLIIESVNEWLRTRHWGSLQASTLAGGLVGDVDHSALVFLSFLPSSNLNFASFKHLCMATIGG